MPHRISRNELKNQAIDKLSAHNAALPIGGRYLNSTFKSSQAIYISNRIERVNIVLILGFVY